MGKIKQASGEDRVVPGLGNRLVVAGAVVEVPDADVYGYTQQSIWDPVDAAAKRAHDEGHTAYLHRLNGTTPEQSAQPDVPKED